MHVSAKNRSIKVIKTGNVVVTIGILNGNLKRLKLMD